MFQRYTYPPKSHAQLLKLFAPKFKYKAELLSGYDGPIIISTEHSIEW